MQKSISYIAWCLYAIFLFVVFTILVDFKTAMIRTLAIITFQIVIFYSNLKWILPRFYEHKKYAIYIVINLTLLAVSLLFNLFLEQFTPHFIEHNTAQHQLELQHFTTEIILINSIPILLAIFISFFLFTLKRQQQQENQALSLLTAEKQFLVQQINPHFLFNTLNNIYFLTYKTSPKGSEAIMQLSKMLDYSLYGEKECNVRIKDEITYINNFIALYKLKDNEIKNIQFDYSNVNTHLKIAPMLLIPFVENAFKHGDIENNGHINIKLLTYKNMIEFNCKNSFVPKKNIDKTGGIGISNVTRRLELLYPNKHKLNIDKNHNDYNVLLKIETNV